MNHQPNTRDVGQPTDAADDRQIAFAGGGFENRRG